MPWTKRQTRFLLSSGSPLTPAQRKKMLQELHQNPSMGDMKKGANKLHSLTTLSANT